MPRPPRYALPDIPQHVIQRGNNRQPIFFDADDYRLYLECVNIAVEGDRVAGRLNPCLQEGPSRSIGDLPFSSAARKDDGDWSRGVELLLRSPFDGLGQLSKVLIKGPGRPTVHDRLC